MPGGGSMLTFRDVTERRNAEQTIREMALIDGLTGLANRHSFDEKIQESLSYAARGTHRVALAMMDLDHFKQVNDNHGHPAGDAVLRQVARILTGSVRAVDTVARLGGDEFAVIFNGYEELDDLRKPNERILEHVAAPFQLPSGNKATIGVSIGIAIVQPEDDSESLIRRADQALYKAKHEGRHRIIFADSE